MNAIFKSKSTRLLSAFLAVLMVVAMLPVTAFAWTAEEGTKCTSTYGDLYLGSDGNNYYSKAGNTLFYNDDGSFYVSYHNGGVARYKYLMIDSNGTSHHVYCIESGVSYNYSDTYNGSSGKNSKYFQNLPITAQYGIMMALMYKHFSFSMNDNPAPEHIHVFESAIDAMSYATMLLLNGRDWKKETFLSLAGVYKTKREKVVPVALERFLKDYPSIKTVHLHLDNDGIGRGAVAGIVSGLQEKYTVLDEPPLHGKDVNDELKIRVGIMREREEIER